MTQCPDLTAHAPHEWIGQALRSTCPGAPARLPHAPRDVVLGANLHDAMHWVADHPELQGAQLFSCHPTSSRGALGLHVGTIHVTSCALAHPRYRDALALLRIGQRKRGQA